MVDDALAFAPAFELRKLIDSKQVSIVELTELFLRRIETINPTLNAYLTVIADEALESSRASEDALMQGEALGPLHGIPISIKDLDVTKGIRTTLGSLLFKDHVPDKDSIVVERVRKSGAIILGKTNTPEFGFSGTTENRLGDACRNPWNPERTSGGSSGGAAAAVASGLCTIATGNDGGGSIRIPSSFCGTYGIKPTRGRVPRSGGVGRAAYSTFSQAGPITRNVRDAAVLLQVLAGPDSRDPACIRQQPPDFAEALDGGVNGLRIGWSSDLGYAAADSEVLSATSQAAQVFEELGSIVEEVEMGLHDPFQTFWDLFSTTAYVSYGHLYESQAEDMTESARVTIEYGAQRTTAEYSRALLRLEQFTAQVDGILEKYDLLLTPTLAVSAFPIDQRPKEIGGRDVNPFWGYTPFTYPFNMTTQPAASIPCGFSSDGLPIGLHMVGRRGEETTVFQASAAFEQARPWTDRRPPVS